MRSVMITLSAVLLLSACASAPVGPTVAVMPPPGKPLSAFTYDDAVCRHDATGQVEGEAAYPNWMRLAVAGGGTLLGAGLGAAIGGGEGAAIGAGAGALGGTAVGTLPSGKAQARLQQRSDVAYSQCIFTRGNSVPGFPQARRRR